MDDDEGPVSQGKAPALVPTVVSGMQPPSPMFGRAHGMQHIPIRVVVRCFNCNAQSPRRVVVSCFYVKSLQSQENPTAFGRIEFYFIFVKEIYYEKL